MSSLLMPSITSSIKTYSTSDAILAYKKYNLSISQVRYMVNNLFYYPTEYKDTLTLYYTECIRTRAFLNSIREGTVKDSARNYQIIYHKTDPTKLKRRKEHTVVRLSYRVPDPIFGLIPTVLVMEIKEPSHISLTETV